MNIEIERKFLLADDTWRALVSRSVRIRDGILAFYDGRKIRIRFYGQKATLTVKGPRKGLARDEFEYDIPQSDGLILLEKHCKGEVVEKTRHHLQVAELEWTIDEYHGLLDGVILAEVELPHEDTRLILPSWVAREVTGVEKYRKINLVKARKKKHADAARWARKRNSDK
ncbi:MULTISPECIES: CYTH domain-containing protein [Pannonibacter]|jgi:CYTH domain-containing protein|uniref:CYTH domain-containing protein n=1 Tax=Pannonibacter TaxID=227873 RepID=UPI000D0EC1F8|nr:MULTISPECIES: CYTH domain-containing protein [Pannonibacter]MBN9491043.1 CYTH domain-containing protein [Alphaproteobacteria bacterium]